MKNPNILLVFYVLNRYYIIGTGTIFQYMYQISTAVSQLCTVPLYNSKVFISGSCPILILTTVLGHSRRTDAKNDVKNYQGPTTYR